MQKYFQHPQEKILETYNYKGVTIDLVAWTDSIWCGKIGYAENNSDEPNVDDIMSGFFALDVPNAAINGREEPNWDVCMSVNYLSNERPNGVMFGFLVNAAQQPEGFDVIRVPAAQYLRLPIRVGRKESAQKLGRKPWRGGIPPYEWIGEDIAPHFSFCYGVDTLPIFEYYGNYTPEKKMHEFCYLYVPVEKI